MIEAIAVVVVVVVVVAAAAALPLVQGAPTLIPGPFLAKMADDRVFEPCAFAPRSALSARGEFED